MKIVALIQQRMGSSRLPGKALMDICGKTLTERVYERVARSRYLDSIHVIWPMDDLLTASAPYSWFVTGEPWDLLHRHQHAAEATKADVIVRVPGDNPLVDPREIDRIVEAFLADPLPGQWLYSNLDKNINGNGYPAGLGAEVYNSWFLHWLDANVGDVAQREHPHKWAFDHGRVRTVEALPGYYAPHLKLSVDTAEDLDMVRDVYAAFGNPPDGEQIIDYLRRHPTYGQSKHLWRADSSEPTRRWHTDDAAQGGRRAARHGRQGDGASRPASRASRNTTAYQPASSPVGRSRRQRSANHSPTRH